MHAQAQTVYTAERHADIQVGAGYARAYSDYDPTGVPYQFNGLALYGTLDLTRHMGAEFDFHHMPSGAGQQPEVYERSYEWGFRYHRTYGRAKPYGRVAYGRGVFNFPNNVANLAYNTIGFGGGADIVLTKRFNLRGDYEYQRWFGFPPHGLTPQLITVGIAYHFPGDMRRGKHY